MRLQPLIASFCKIYVKIGRRDARKGQKKFLNKDFGSKARRKVEILINIYGHRNNSCMQNNKFHPRSIFLNFKRNFGTKNMLDGSNNKISNCKGIAWDNKNKYWAGVER